MIAVRGTRPGDGIAGALAARGLPLPVDGVPDSATPEETAAPGEVDGIVLLSPVGCDVVPGEPERSFLRAEEALASSGRRWAVIRRTPTHDEVWADLARRADRRIMTVPAEVRLQPVDPASVAAAVAAIVEGDRWGEVLVVGGPRAYEAKDLARSFLAAAGRRRRPVPLPAWGIRGAALRAGANLTPERDTTGATWNDFVRARLALAAWQRPPDTT